MASSWILIAKIFSIAGLYLILSKLLEYLANIVSRIVYSAKKKYMPVAMRWVKENNEVFDSRTSMTAKVVMTSLANSMIFWVILALVSALICFDKLLSIAIFGIVITFGYLYISNRNTKLLRVLNRDTENLIINFRSRYPIKKSIYETLEDVTEDIPTGQLKNSLMKVRNSLRLNIPLQEAVRPLADLNNTSLRQFAVILSDISDPDTFDEILSSLLNDVKSRSNLLGEIRRTLTVLRVTILILQGISILAYLISSFAPAWRSFFLADNYYVLFLILAIFSGFASFFVELEIKKLEEA